MPRVEELSNEGVDARTISYVDLPWEAILLKLKVSDIARASRVSKHLHKATKSKDLVRAHSFLLR